MADPTPAGGAAGTVPRWRWGDPLAPVEELLASGGVVAIPTESSYGLAVDPRNRRGVEAVYDLKGRQGGKALPVVVADAAQAIALGVPAELPEWELLASTWPAPLTAVLPLDRPLPAAGGGSTLAVRVPAHRRLRELLSGVGFGLTATSANRSGAAPVVDPAELDALLDRRRALVIDDGVLPGGPPSTLVRWEDGKLHVLRAGAYPASRLPPDLPPSPRPDAPHHDLESTR